MKSKLLPFLLLLLLILNGVLIFILVNKLNERKNRPQRNFLTEQLLFSDRQRVEFKSLDKIHRSFMVDLDAEIRANKDLIFNSFNTVFNLDSITNQIGKLEAQKEKELFRFFSEVRGLCSEKQAKKFDKIIKEALKGGDRRPPRDDRMPPPKGGKHY